MPEIWLQTVGPDAWDTLTVLLHDALPEKERIRAILQNPAMTSYLAWQGAEHVGAAVVAWGPESEIDLLAVAPERRGQGVGKRIVAALLAEARRRCVQAMLVGTANFSLDNIAFYQKCGFRMSTVRRDYFAPRVPPVMQHGIELRDMIVFEYPLTGEHT